MTWQAASIRLYHTDDLETIVRSVANLASLTSILATGSEVAALAANFKRIGGRVTVMRDAVPALVNSTAIMFRDVKRTVQTLCNYSDIVHRVTVLMGTANQSILTFHA
jgi:hypothetical protein